MSGRFIAVVGPSGVGKDSVLQALVVRDPRFVLARRVITRPSEADGEAFDGVSLKDFRARLAAGDFALNWAAHGLHYGIPASVDQTLNAGRDVLANLSRSVLVEAQRRFAKFQVLSLTADSAVLAARLTSRGRETPEDITKRLARSGTPLPAGLPVLELDNSGALDGAVTRALALLYPVSA